MWEPPSPHKLAQRKDNDRRLFVFLRVVVVVVALIGFYGLQDVFLLCVFLFIYVLTLLKT